MADTPVTVQNRPDPPLSPIGIGVILGTVAVDQASKLIAEQSLDYGQPIDILPILSLYRVYNPGIAFSLLSSFGAFGLIAVTAVVALFVLTLWHRTADGGRLAAIGYALIIGGALGNLVDRLAHGHVIDFLFLHFGEQSLFVFNLADAALTIGPALLILVYLLPAGRRARS